MNYLLPYTKLAFLIPLILFAGSSKASGQSARKCFIYWINASTDSATLIRAIEYSLNNLPLVEIDYGRNDAETGGLIYDTSYYQSKKFYHYNKDLLLISVKDCQARNSDRLAANYWNNGTHIAYDYPAVNTKDTFITFFNYDSKGRLSKKYNSRTYQSYVYNEVGQIQSDTIAGEDWDNYSFWSNFSVGSYTYFKDGYSISREFDDGQSSRIDSFFLKENRVQRHFLRRNIYSPLPCERGISSSGMDYSLQYDGKGRITSKTYFSSEGIPSEIEKYICRE